MKQRLLGALFLLLIPAALHADPIPLVNTGPGPATLPGLELNSLQWIAVEFDLGRASVITSVEGWILPLSSGSLDVSLYRGGGDIPGALLFRSTEFVNSGSADWRGPSGLTWSVTPGSYWIGFETPGPRPMGGAMPGPVPHPLSHAAVVDGESNSGYYAADSSAASIGLRVSAQPAPVPEPASMLLMGTGIAALVLRRRLRSAK